MNTFLIQHGCKYVHIRTTCTNLFCRSFSEKNAKACKKCEQNIEIGGTIGGNVFFTFVPNLCLKNAFLANQKQIVGKFIIFHNVYHKQGALRSNMGN